MADQELNQEGLCKYPIEHTLHGWIFWDETWAYCYGYFSTYDEAYKALILYCEKLK